VLRDGRQAIEALLLEAVKLHFRSSLGNGLLDYPLDGWCSLRRYWGLRCLKRLKMLPALRCYTDAGCYSLEEAGVASATFDKTLTNQFVGLGPLDSSFRDPVALGAKPAKPLLGSWA